MLRVYLRLALLGCGFMGITLLWSIYNAYVPIFLQAGRPGFTASANVHGYGLSATAAGFIMTLDNIAALFILPFVGAWSDRLRTRWGRRKPFIAVGAPLGAVGFVLVPGATSGAIAGMMAAIAITLFAMDLFRTPTVALMADITPSPQRSQANGMINLMGGVGAVLGYYVGGKLFAVSPAAPFIFGAVAMLAGSLTVLLTIREPPPEEAAPGEEEPHLLTSLREILRGRDPSALRLLGAILAWFLAYSALEVFFTSFATNELNMLEGEATVLLAYFTISIVATAVPAGWLGGWLGRRRMVLLGIACFALMLLVGISVSTVEEGRLMLVLAGISWSLIVVNSLPMVMDCAPPSRVGTYTGLYYLASMSSSVIGPILAGHVITRFDSAYRIMFVYGFVALGLAFLLMVGVTRGEATRAVDPLTD